MIIVMDSGPFRIPFLHVAAPEKCARLRDLEGAYSRGGCVNKAGEFAGIFQTVPHSNSAAFLGFLSGKSVFADPEVDVIELVSGRVFADGVVISSDGRALARDCAPDFRQPFENHWLLSVPRLRRPKRVAGRLLVVASHAADNYYHWLLEELPRLLLAIEATEFDRILLTENLFSNSVLQCLRINVPQLPVTSISHYQAESLVVPTYLSPVGFPSPRIVSLLSSFAKKYASCDEERRPDRIYISRKGGRRRTVHDEPRLIDALQERGFREVLLETMSLQEQIRTFRAARFVVAPHGAGLANLAFCERGGHVIELFNNGYVHHCFAQLAELVGMSYTGLCSDPDQPVGHGILESQEEIRVPLDVILEWVDRELQCE
jgi:capsular polysaccharide biosynthesis protein